MAEQDEKNIGIVQRYRLDLDGTLLPEWCMGCNELFEWDEMTKYPLDAMYYCEQCTKGRTDDDTTD